MIKQLFPIHNKRDFHGPNLTVSPLLEQQKLYGFVVFFEIRASKNNIQNIRIAASIPTSKVHQPYTL